MNLLKTIAAAAAIACGAASANAATIFASQVIDRDQPAGVDPSRSDANAALGAADGNFYSLGLGGWIILGFDSLFTGPGVIWEITFGNAGAHPEKALIEFSLGGATWTGGTVVSNSDAQSGATFTFAGVFDQIRITDQSPYAQGRDGFDLDAIGVSPVPIPAAGLLLLGGLGGLAMLRRRKSSAAAV